MLSQSSSASKDHVAPSISPVIAPSDPLIIVNPEPGVNSTAWDWHTPFSSPMTLRVILDKFGILMHIISFVNGCWIDNVGHITINSAICELAGAICSDDMCKLRFISLNTERDGQDNKQNKCPHAKIILAF